MQEPFSVLFSLANFGAHFWGVGQLRQQIPASYRLRKYYLAFGYCGFVSWLASAVFHTRDFLLTERVDYFGAGLSVLYGFYFAPIRVFRLDDPKGNQPWKHSIVRLWTLACILMYIAHISYLQFWRWDYTYNMAANIAVGIIQNILWTGFAWSRYMKSGKFWQAWPAIIVAWIILAMSMEILDFPPWGLMIDAHSLWHLGTVGPTFWWYKYVTLCSLSCPLRLTPYLQLFDQGRPRRPAYPQIQSLNDRRLLILAFSRPCCPIRYRHSVRFPSAYRRLP